MRLQAILLALARHLGTYLELGAAAAVEYRRVWLRRVVLLMLAALAFFVGVAALWLTGLVALWGTGWAMAYVMGSSALLLVIAFAAGTAAMAQSGDGPASKVLRNELSKDVEFYNEWTSTISS